jgi:hypothetical protein
MVAEHYLYVVCRRPVALQSVVTDQVRGPLASSRIYVHQIDRLCVGLDVDFTKARTAAHLFFWRCRAQTFDEGRLNRVNRRSGIVFAQLVHEATNAERADADEVMFDCR